MLPALITALAVLIVWSALVLPDRLFLLTPAAFLRIPIEALVLVGLALLLPPRWVRTVAAVAGVLLGLLAVVRLLDLGFHEALHRPFNPVTDGKLLGPAVDMLGDSLGPGWADAALVGAILLFVALPTAVTLSVIRICRAAAHRRTASSRIAGSLAVLWLVTAVLGTQPTPGVPIASRGAAQLAVDQARAAAHNLGDLSAFRSQLAADDPWSTVPGEDLLIGLRGKDVIVAFVESYGRVAVEGSAFSPEIRTLLDDGTTTLRAAGFSSRSAFLTSSTFGGISWLAHATFHSGLWVDSQQRYDQLLSSDRFTLSAAFARAGWRTVVDVPSNRDPWPEGRAFYRFDEDYDRHDVGYEGPKFSFAAIPDQYTLAAFERLELAPGHAPVMAEIDLVSSHEPWTPLPRLLDWDALGDGSVYDGMPAEGLAPGDVFGNARPGEGLVRGVDRVLAQRPDLVRDDVPRAGRRPRARPGRRPPARPDRHRAARLARRPDHDHRPRSGRHGPDFGMGLGRRDAARPRCAGVAHGCVPRPVPDRVWTVVRRGRCDRGTTLSGSPISRLSTPAFPFRRARSILGR